MDFLIPLGLLVCLPLLIVAIMYNGFVSRRNAMRHAFSSIDVQLKKRWELIPNLVETVKKYASHEKETMEAVVQARNARSDSKERFDSEAKISQGVGRLFAIAEDYPDLKAGDQFLNLQRNLTEIESQISASRRAYNAAVTDWNEGVEAFPGNILAGMFNFERADWFEARTQERDRVDVNLS